MSTPSGPYGHFDDPIKLTLWQVRAELVQLMGWLKDGDAFGRWEPFEGSRIWIKSEMPIDATLDAALASLPPGWHYQGAMFGSHPDDPPSDLWTAFAKPAPHMVTFLATGETELIARFRLAVAAWKRHKEKK